MTIKQFKTDFCVLGGGLTGLTAALALSDTGAEVALCAPVPTNQDKRTTALLNGTVQFFDKLDLWSSIKDTAFPLKTMRITDGTKRLIRIPQTEFHSSELGMEAFGYNVQNDALLELLRLKILNNPSITCLEGIAEIEFANHKTLIRVQNAKDQQAYEITSGFIVGADGRNSVVREAFSLGQREWSYNQSAIVTDFEHQFPTNFISTEFHTET